MRDARPLRDNRYKIALAQRAIVRSVNVAAGRERAGVTGASA
jgi:xanthine dehydrogenase YagS FAD-binding subunit